MWGRGETGLGPAAGWCGMWCGVLFAQVKSGELEGGITGGAEPPMPEACMELLAGTGAGREVLASLSEGTKQLAKAGPARALERHTCWPSHAGDAAGPAPALRWAMNS